MVREVSTDLPLVPLGSGDLIDRAVRLYRRHLLVLIRIAAPPVFVSVGAFFLARWAPVWMSAIVGVIGFLGASALAMWLFFFMVGRIAYVPQVMLVEGKRIFESMSRSFSLARGNVRRIMAMTLFI